MAIFHGLSSSGTNEQLIESIDNHFKQRIPEYSNNMRTSQGILKFETNFLIDEPKTIDELTKSELVGLMNKYKISKPSNLPFALIRKEDIKKTIIKEISRRLPTHPTNSNGSLIFEPE